MDPDRGMAVLYGPPPPGPGYGYGSPPPETSRSGVVMSDNEPTNQVIYQVFEFEWRGVMVMGPWTTGWPLAFRSSLFKCTTTRIRHEMRGSVESWIRS